MSESLLSEFNFGSARFHILLSDRKYALRPVESCEVPNNKVDALAFSWSLNQSRKVLRNIFWSGGDTSLHDAIYVEQFSRLLPTWTSTPYVDDKVVLGTWLTGGVVVSTDSFERLTRLVGWLPVSDLAEIVKTAGIEVPAEGLEEKPAFRSRQVKKPEQKTPNFHLPGRQKLEEFFNEHVVDIVFNAEKYQALGIEFPAAIVLHGPPGCGKTFAVQRLIDFLGWPSYFIDSGSVGSPYIHETSRKIAEVFDNAVEYAPCAVVIDEMESFLSDRQASSKTGLYHVEEVAEFLRRIPEAVKKKVLVIAMTNMIDAIDPAVLRRGRFDHIIEMEMPSRVETASLIDFLLKGLPKNDGLKMDALYDALTGRALSDSAFVVREAARLAARAGKSRIDQERIEQALSLLPDEKKKRSVGFRQQ
ncbi:MAG: ATP-binding protein [Synergistaceae bacterium]|nr:ATP-binding protein [Synergistaceae bacterium]